MASRPQSYFTPPSADVVFNRRDFLVEVERKLYYQRRDDSPKAQCALRKPIHSPNQLLYPETDPSKLPKYPGRWRVIGSSTVCEEPPH